MQSQERRGGRFPYLRVPVKNSPFNAGNEGSVPGQVIKTPHAVGQIKPHTATDILHTKTKAGCSQINK